MVLRVVLILSYDFNKAMLAIVVQYVFCLSCVLFKVLLWNGFGAILYHEVAQL
jgi:hypothetical protein